MRMRWDDLAFLHYRLEASRIRPLLPAGVELECHDGSAWIGVVPFKMENVAARGLPVIPGTGRFLELNLRTYVRVNDRPGVWFFSLDASNRLAVRGARGGFCLPYFDAVMSVTGTSRFEYRSRRLHHGAIPGVFEGSYEGGGKSFVAESGSFEAWLTERYCLFAQDRSGRITCGHVHHRPWSLRRCEVEMRRNTLGNLIGLSLGCQPDHSLFSKTLDVVAWWPEPA